MKHGDELSSYRVACSILQCRRARHNYLPYLHDCNMPFAPKICARKYMRVTIKPKKPRRKEMLKRLAVRVPASSSPSCFKSKFAILAFTLTASPLCANLCRTCSCRPCRMVSTFQQCWKSKNDFTTKTDHLGRKRKPSCIVCYGDVCARLEKTDLCLQVLNEGLNGLRYKHFVG